MNKLNSLLWIGLASNIIFWILLLIDYMGLHGSEAEYISTFWWLCFLSIIIQFISIPLLLKAPLTGQIVGVLGSALMLPTGIAFMFGCFYSVEKLKNQQVAKVAAQLHNQQCIQKTAYRNKIQLKIDNVSGLKQPAEPLSDEVMQDNDVQLKFKTIHFLINDLVVFISGGIFLICMVGGNETLFILFLLLFISGCFLRNRIFIALDKGSLILTPGLYAETYRVPLDDVLLVHDNQKSFGLLVKTPGEEQFYELKKNLIRGNNAQERLGEILLRLDRIS
ncbi:hypothetical protein [Mixta intestinalis]|uniref:Uncharacterized protein n=1 Tax=Mixta intestinalis TaxID=1615494 RepID=A0A6P1Q195_9GAMM|nr:hypothetical protein [Mixta intestinalis]QHM71907.1 hypothetical protein C7M51_02200 [Mixta intestinalis]